MSDGEDRTWRDAQVSASQSRSDHVVHTYEPTAGFIQSIDYLSPEARRKDKLFYGGYIRPTEHVIKVTPVPGGKRPSEFKALTRGFRTYLEPNGDYLFVPFHYNSPTEVVAVLEGLKPFVMEKEDEAKPHPYHEFVNKIKAQLEGPAIEYYI